MYKALDRHIYIHYIILYIIHCASSLPVLNCHWQLCFSEIKKQCHLLADVSVDVAIFPAAIGVHSVRNHLHP